MLPPLAADIDGTLTRGDGSIDPRTFDPLRAYAAEAPVVIATGKSFPFPVGLCEFVGIPIRVIAENGGVVYTEDADAVAYTGDPEAISAFSEAYRDAHGDFGWGSVDTVNRWRETEVAIAREHDREPIDRLADEYGLDVVDTGYAYHVKSATVNKATGLRTIADELGIDTDAFVAVGDSENDAEIFAAAGRSYAVANADDTARSAADFVVDAEFADGFLAAIDLIEAE